VERVNRFVLAAIFTGLALFLTGTLRTLVTKRNALRGGLEMVLVGGSAAVLAYAAGSFLSGFGV
jgi:vacuolar iron transporter family protein